MRLASSIGSGLAVWEGKENKDIFFNMLTNSEMSAEIILATRLYLPKNYRLQTWVYLRKWRTPVSSGATKLSLLVARGNLLPTYKFTSIFL